MAAYSSVALVSAHPQIPAFLSYGISDLVELCSLAAFIRDVVDEVSIPVGPADRDPLAGFSTFVGERRPQLVGISAYTCGIASALRYARIARESGALVAVGGYHASALPDELLASDDIDAVVRGEGEHTLRELVLDGPSRQIRGLSFKDGRQVVHNPGRPLIDDLDTLPAPLREIRPRRFGLDGDDYHVDTVYASRGCRGNCTFCANRLVGRRWRPRSSQRVVEELASIAPGRRRKPKLIKLWDADFLTDAGRVLELCDQIIAAGLHTRFRFVAETRVNDIIRARGILGRMREAGFHSLGTGVESPNPDTLRWIRKAVEPEAVQQAARLVASSGMSFSEFFVIGCANETVSDILAYADFAVAGGHRKQSAYFFILTPYPGTQVWTEYSQQGLVASRDWNLYTNYHAVIEPNGIPRLTLQALAGTLPMQHTLAKRFARGEPFSRLALKMMVILLASAKATLAQTSYRREELEDCVWQSLAYLRDVAPRQRSGRQRRNLRLMFYPRGHDPIAVTFASDGSTDRIVVTRGEPAAARGTTTWRFSLQHLHRLVELIDVRRTGHDLLVLIFRPTAMRLTWLLGLALQAVRLAPTLVAIVAFHSRRSVMPGRWRACHPLASSARRWHRHLRRSKGE